MSSRSHFEAKLTALHEFYRQRMISAPDNIFESIRPQLWAMRAALSMPEAALPIIRGLAERQGNKNFHAFVQRVGVGSGSSSKAPVAKNEHAVAAGVPLP